MDVTVFLFLPWNLIWTLHWYSFFFSSSSSFFWHIYSFDIELFSEPSLTWTLRPGSSPSRSSTRQRNAAGDMQAEAVGQELRRFGDDFNTLLLLRRVAGGRRHVIRPIRLPRIHQEPTVLFCVGLLLLVIGRMIYWPGGWAATTTLRFSLWKTQQT